MIFLSFLYFSSCNQFIKTLDKILIKNKIGTLNIFIIFINKIEQ
jgi:hypothetical protein